MTYKGMMLSDVPNLAFTLGYTNASWTLKADLTCEYVCRLLNHMDAHGYAACVPRANGDPARATTRSSTSPPATSCARSTSCPSRAPASPWQLQHELRQRPPRPPPRPARRQRHGVLHPGPSRARRAAPSRPSPDPATPPAPLGFNPLPAPWRSGYAAACKAVYTGSIPVGAFPANQLFPASQLGLRRMRPIRLKPVKTGCGGIRLAPRWHPKRMGPRRVGGLLWAIPLRDDGTWNVRRRRLWP